MCGSSIYASFSPYSEQRLVRKMYSRAHPFPESFCIMQSAILLVLFAMPSGILGQCDVCQTAVHAACHSETSFSICIDGVPTKDLIQCPPGYHCTGGKYICYPEAIGTVNCKTANTPSDPSLSCKDIQDFGDYKNEADPTCTTFITCNLSNGEWIGVVSQCRPLQWFNGDYCVPNKPDNCE